MNLSPPRLIELECPRCSAAHWAISGDHRVIRGEPGPSGRYQNCPACGHQAPSFPVRRASPPAFFMQPHDLYPAPVPEFRSWLEILRAHFPDHPRLADLGISWYPGERDPDHEERLHDVLVTGPRYRMWLTAHRAADEQRTLVFVQGIGEVRGEAVFALDATIEPVRLVYGFDEPERATIRAVIAENADRFRAASAPFYEYVEKRRAKWLALIDGSRA